MTNRPADEFPVWATQLGAQVVVTDLDGDGREDLALVGGRTPETFGGLGRAWVSIPTALSNGDGTFRISNPGVAEFPSWAVYGARDAEHCRIYLPPTALSGSQSRRHRMLAIMENVDDTIRIWNGYTDDGRRQPSPPMETAPPPPGIFDVDSGPYPRSGVFDITHYLMSRSERAEIIVGLGNGLGGACSGRMRLIVDGVEMYRAEASGSACIYGWFLGRYWRLDVRRGLIYGQPSVNARECFYSAESY